MQPKFNIGDEVKFFKDTDSLGGKILSFAYDPQLETFRYTFETRQLDLENMTVHPAVKHALEDELLTIGEAPVLDEVVEEEPVEETPVAPVTPVVEEAHE